MLFSGFVAAERGRMLERMEPAVDFPIQFNFGSPYSSSLTVFFDFDLGEVERKAGAGGCVAGEPVLPPSSTFST